tara:strand:- start:850 stop:1260 length:411 start_codon:yes stop_codon:yes gene_type:complete
MFFLVQRSSLNIKMKKILITIFTLFAFNSFAVEKSTTFTKEIFNNSQKEGKIVVINSWNKTCTTCAKQIEILNMAEDKFKNVSFLSFEQEKDKEIAKFLKIDYWTTILIFKDNKEIYRSIGQTDKSKIFNVIKENI